ncbi:MAG: DUF6259 domain-containing protein [Armatimonadota bacterium]
MTNPLKLIFLMIIGLNVIFHSPCDAAIRSSRLEVDLRNGTAVSVKNLLTGESYTSPGTNECLAGLYAIDGKTKIYADTHKVASAYDAKSVMQKAVWDVGSAESEFNFDSSGDLIVTQSGQSSAKGVYGISWGITGIPDSLTVLVPGDSGQRFGSDAPYGMRTFDYPYTWESPFVVIQGKRGGVIVYAEDPSYRFKSLFIEHADGCFRIRLESRNQAPFDDQTSIKSVKWRMRAYKGPWQTGAEIYRKWMVSQRKPIPLAKKQRSWARHIRLAVTMGIDVPLLAELAKRVDPAKTLLYIPDWRKDGYDRNYPDYTAHPDFPAFVDAAHKLGFKVMAHANYFGCDPNHPLYADLSKYQMKDPFTKEPQYWVTPLDPTIRVAYISPASKTWRTIFVSRMKELVDRYKVDALHIDQTWVMINDANGLIDGMNTIEGNIRLHKELNEALPQVAISGEGLDEVTCIYESFAQRHVTGVDTWSGSWNNRRLAQAHPISSYILAPYTTMIGLWLPDIDANLGLFSAWRKAYEQYGVIPSLPRPRIDQLMNPTPLMESLIKDIRFFQRYEPTTDFASPWKLDDIFRYTLNDGRKAFYRIDKGAIFGTEGKDGKVDVLFRRISGVGRIEIGGSIPGWMAYNGKEIIGLNPEHDYIWTDKPRDNDVVHISSILSDVVLSQAEMHSEFMRFHLDNRSNAIALWDYEGRSACGVFLASGGEKRYSGINFTDESGGLAKTDGENLLVHPPWKTTGKVSDGSVGLTFIEYNLSLPAADRITFSAGAGLLNDMVGKSDGIRLLASVSDGIYSITGSVDSMKAELAMLNLDLTRYAGKQVKLRLEIDPGPADSPSYDWTLITRPVIDIERNRPGSVEIRSKIPPTGALAAFGKVDIEKVDDGTYRLDLSLPNTVTVPFTVPANVSLPYNLVSAAHTAHSLNRDGKEGPLAGYSSVGVEEVSCLNDKRISLFQHPPDFGKTLVDFWIKLPDSPVKLVTAIGLRDGSKSDGASFEVWVNGRSIFSRKVAPDTGWLPVEVDLSAYVGQSVMLTLVTDSLGSANSDWTAWADPKLVE